jgi:hypothetical protein
MIYLQISRLKRITSFFGAFNCSGKIDNYQGSDVDSTLEIDRIISIQFIYIEHYQAKLYRRIAGCSLLLKRVSLAI